MTLESDNDTEEYGIPFFFYHDITIDITPPINMECVDQSNLTAVSPNTKLVLSNIFEAGKQKMMYMDIHNVCERQQKGLYK